MLFYFVAGAFSIIGATILGGQIHFEMELRRRLMPTSIHRRLPATQGEKLPHRIIVVGRPASGKGTQGKILAKKYGIEHYSSGDMMRNKKEEYYNAMKTDDPFEAKGLWYWHPVYVEARNRRDNAGVNAAVWALAKKFLEKDLGNGETNLTKGFILDGFPRTLEQAIMLDRYLEKKKAPLTDVVEIDVPEDECKRRAKSRARNAKDADITSRLTSYTRPDARGTYPIIPYFQNKQIYTGRYSCTKTDKEKETLVWDAETMLKLISREDRGDIEDLSWVQDDRGEQLRYVQRKKESIHRYVDGMAAPAAGVSKTESAVTEEIVAKIVKD